jgi:hypothetical protein
MSDVPLVQQIPASVVRQIAQSPPEPGDFRERFPLEQEDLDTYVTIRLDELDPVAAEFAGRVAAALWAIYERAGNVQLPKLDSKQVEALEPVARKLLDELARRKDESQTQTFDPEWLIELRFGPQPHVMGFLIGALRASRLGFDGQVIFEVAVVLLAVAGVLEAAAARFRSIE